MEDEINCDGRIRNGNDHHDHVEGVNVSSIESWKTISNSLSRNENSETTDDEEDEETTTDTLQGALNRMQTFLRTVDSHLRRVSRKSGLVFRVVWIVRNVILSYALFLAFFFVVLFDVNITLSTFYACRSMWKKEPPLFIEMLPAEVCFFNTISILSQWCVLIYLSCVLYHHLLLYLIYFIWSKKQYIYVSEFILVKCGCAKCYLNEPLEEGNEQGEERRKFLLLIFKISVQLICFILIEVLPIPISVIFSMIGVGISNDYRGLFYWSILFLAISLLLTNFIWCFFSVVDNFIRLLVCCCYLGENQKKYMEKLQNMDEEDFFEDQVSVLIHGDKNYYLEEVSDDQEIDSSSEDDDMEAIRRIFDSSNDNNNDNNNFVLEDFDLELYHEDEDEEKKEESKEEVDSEDGYLLNIIVYFCCFIRICRYLPKLYLCCFCLLFVLFMIVTTLFTFIIFIVSVSVSFDNFFVSSLGLITVNSWWFCFFVIISCSLFIYFCCCSSCTCCNGSKRIVPKRDPIKNPLNYEDEEIQWVDFNSRLTFCLEELYYQTPYSVISKIRTLFVLVMIYLLIFTLFFTPFRYLIPRSNNSDLTDPESKVPVSRYIRYYIYMVFIGLVVLVHLSCIYYCYICRYFSFKNNCSCSWFFDREFLKWVQKEYYRRIKNINIFDHNFIPEIHGLSLVGGDFNSSSSLDSEERFLFGDDDEQKVRKTGFDDDDEISSDIIMSSDSSDSSGDNEEGGEEIEMNEMNTSPEIQEEPTGTKNKRKRKKRKRRKTRRQKISELERNQSPILKNLSTSCYVYSIFCWICLIYFVIIIGQFLSIWIINFVHYIVHFTSLEEYYEYQDFSFGWILVIFVCTVSFNILFCMCYPCLMCCLGCFICERRRRFQSRVRNFFFFVFVILIFSLFVIGALYDFGSPKESVTEEELITKFKDGLVLKKEDVESIPNDQKYVICNQTWSGLDIVDIIFFTEMSYQGSTHCEGCRDLFMELFIPQCRGGKCQIIAERNEDVNFVHIHSPSEKFHIISIRGSTELMDFIQDFNLWKEIGILQFANFFIPVLESFGNRFVRIMVCLWDVFDTIVTSNILQIFYESFLLEGVYRLSSDTDLSGESGKNFYYDEVLTYLENIIFFREDEDAEREDMIKITSDESLYIVGHSLGGGLAKIVSMKMDLMFQYYEENFDDSNNNKNSSSSTSSKKPKQILAFSFAGPGVVISSGKFFKYSMFEALFSGGDEYDDRMGEFEIMLDQDVVNIQPEVDIVSSIDFLGGTVQNIGCDSQSILGCHGSIMMMRSLLTGCGDRRSEERSVLYG